MSLLQGRRGALPGPCPDLARWLLGVALVLAWPPAPLCAQLWILGLGEQGQVTANGAALETLQSAFKAKDDLQIALLPHGQQRWWDLVVRGSDRYALRLDGQVVLNGQPLHALPFEALPWCWIGLAFTGNQLWALRSDGLLSRDGAAAGALPADNQVFVALAGAGTEVLALRSDGAVFRASATATLETTPLYDLEGGGLADGALPRTRWRTFVVDLPRGRLLALRVDGRVVSAALDGSDPFAGVLIANLSFEDPLTEAKAYVDLAVRDDGRWLVLRGRGIVWGSEDPFDPLLDLPGGPGKKLDLAYVALEASGQEYYVLRRDGAVYRGSDGAPMVDLPKGRYRGLGLSTEAPDLSAVTNRRPLVARYRPRLVEGSPFVLPVVATDLETPSDELVVTPDLDTLPPGAAWDGATRRLTWNAPGPPGKHVFVVTVDDGTSKPVKVAFPLPVRPAVAEGVENGTPLPVPIKKAAAQLQQPFVLPILATDPEGDALTVVLVGEVPAGASFDTATRQLHWTPGHDQLGRQGFQFVVSDGVAARKFTVTVKVVAGLLPW